MIPVPFIWTVIGVALLADAAFYDRAKILELLMVIEHAPAFDMTYGVLSRKLQRKIETSLTFKKRQAAKKQAERWISPPFHP